MAGTLRETDTILMLRLMPLCLSIRITNMVARNRGGRPPISPSLRRVNVPLRLPAWLVQWMAERAETPAELIEAALLKAHKLRPPRAP